MKARVLPIGNAIQAYKGYLITKLMGGEFAVSKDDYHICYASGIDDAKAKIDELA